MGDAVDDLFSAFNSHDLPILKHDTKEENLVNKRDRASTLQEPQKKRGKTVIDEEDEELFGAKTSCSSTEATNGHETGQEDTEPKNASHAEVFVETYEGDHNCLHECVRPAEKEEDAENKGSSTNPYLEALKKEKSKPPAREFPYKLDPFQATAVRCLEAGESVLVSAHTSAGKTTVAEYAIAMGLRDKQRVIYTSPIKALSNQKYRDLSNMYGNEVGLLTGDVSLNPSASVVIMTTEILRSMLYRGSEMVREMKWVIFDEIHYMRDRDRGVVWEETIILLPDTVRLVFLSATIPNAREFAEWICRVKHQPCHVIYTDYRPVPLQHYLFPAGGDGVHLVMDEKKNFKEENFHKALSELTHTVDSLGTETKARQARKSAKNDIEKIIMMCHERHYTPVIVFAFSKREVEANALALKKVKLTTPEEEQLIETVFNNAMDTLGEDRNLPQITCMMPLLKRGIGLHHGGLLPIVKEVIEILFQESLVKVLFSTETFSMGVNMPAKTVVFTKLKKWDGTAFRMISAGEYIQMSGRAGRRGLDDRGLTIIMFDEQLEPDTAKNLFLGEPLRIESQFHLGYNMLLNLLRVEGANPEYMIQRSFFQFQQDKATLQLEEKLKHINKELQELSNLTHALPDEKIKLLPQGLDINRVVGDYFSVKHRLQNLAAELRGIIMQPRYALRFLQVGRVVRVATTDHLDWGYGIISEQVQRQRSIPKKDPTPGSNHRTAEESVQYVITVLLRCAAPSASGQPLRPVKSAPSVEDHSVNADTSPSLEQETSVWEPVPCQLGMVQEITQVVATVPGTGTSTLESRAAMGEILNKISQQLNGNFPLLDPVEHMHIESPRVKEILRDTQCLEESLTQNPLHGHAVLPTLYSRFYKKVQLNSEKQELEQRLDSQKHLVMKDDLRAMRRVLRKLEYLDANNIVTVKGRAACEVSSVDELVMCELLFQNTFHKMENNDLVAMLSCLVFEEKSDDTLPRNPKLAAAFECVKEVATRVAEASVESKLPISVTDYVAKFKPVLMEIVYKWMQGHKFSELGISEDLFEGSVVRAIRRLEELLRQVACAAKSIGEQDLEMRLAQAILKIRRGIVFSASLYL